MIQGFMREQQYQPQDQVDFNEYTYYFNFITENNISWLINLIKYINLGIHKYEGVQYVPKEMTYYENNYKIIIEKAIEIINEIKLFTN